MHNAPKKKPLEILTAGKLDILTQTIESLQKLIVAVLLVG